MTKSAQTIHAFELAGLGAAPYTYSHNTTSFAPSLNPTPGGFNQTPCGTCDFCGTCIGYECNFVSADGNKFIVGEVCIFKAGDRGLIKKVKAEAAKRRREAGDALAEQLVEEVGNHSEVLATIPHTLAWKAAQGATALDQWNWLMGNCGRTGKIKWGKKFLKLIEAAAVGA